MFGKTSDLVDCDFFQKLHVPFRNDVVQDHDPGVQAKDLFLDERVGHYGGSVSTVNLRGEDLQDIWQKKMVGWRASLAQFRTPMMQIKTSKNSYSGKYI